MTKSRVQPTWGTRRSGIWKRVQLDGGMVDPMWKKGTSTRIWLLGLEWQPLPADATAQARAGRNTSRDFAESERRDA